MYISYDTPFPTLSTSASLADVIKSHNNLVEFLNSQNFPDPNLGTGSK